jgi:general stress protein YciG
MMHDDDHDSLNPGQQDMSERSSGEMPQRSSPMPMPMNNTPMATEGEAPAPRKKARRGFAAMSAEKQKEIASLGGKAAHAKGTAHEFSPEEAREAGRKGGQAAQRARSQTKH